jgi:hypothetical protein
LVPSVTWEPYTSSVVWDITQTYAKRTVVLNSNVYYRALQTVPPGVELADVDYWAAFVPNSQSKVNFGTTFGVNDGISLVVMGTQVPQYSWSTPQTQQFVADASLVALKILNCDNPFIGTNPANLIVNRNGVRLRPPACVEWTGDGTSLQFGLPQRQGYDQSLINAVSDVTVYVNNVLQVQSFGAVIGSYSVSNWTGSNTPGRQIVFDSPPAPGDEILVCVTTEAGYFVIPGNRVQIVGPINLGDLFTVTSWNDTSQQKLCTLVYVGPTTVSVGIVQGFDSVPFDSATVVDTPGSFDYSGAITVASNELDLRPGQTASRLYVTLNGYKLLEGQDYVVQNDQLILSSGLLASNDVVAITEFAEDTVPDAMAFRIFQDMRGNQTTYRITAQSTTTLTADLSATADVAYVDNVLNLSEPNLTEGLFGVVTIDGERITYRERNVPANAILGLSRGTAGTAASTHSAGSEVYDMGIGNRMPQSDQNYIVSETFVGDGSTTSFVTANLGNVASFGDSSTVFADSIEVYVGGIRARPGVPVAEVIVGNTYTIASIGDTDWYAMGLPLDQYPAPGVVFTVTDLGTGTGIVGTSISTHYYQLSNWDPLTFTFLTADDLPAPESGIEVTFLERRGINWYQPGTNTASNGQPLQLTDTEQARFLRGE